MTLIVDKRLLPKNQSVNSRQKFIDRYKDAIKKRIKEIVSKGNLTDTLKGDKKIKIKADDLAEPQFDFEHGTGRTDRIYVGNKKFHKGQKVSRPSGGKGQGSGGGNNGGGEDDFEFTLTEKEFADLFFEDLALPDLVKKSLFNNNVEIKHAGLSRTGGPTSLNVRKTMINALGRRLAMRNTNPYLKSLTDEEFKALCTRQALQNSACQGSISEASHKKKIQLIEDIDLRYNFKDKVEVPTTRAAMYCLMDVSGSMGEREKDIAKRFYILLNMFLKRNYDQVDVVFVRHAETAEEVDEKTFFYDRKSGGTIISSGYELISDLIKQKHNPEQWNIYIAQASDGENWPNDMAHMEDVLVQKLLPITQYFAYIDIRNTYGKLTGEVSDVLSVIKRLMPANSNLQGREIDELNQIYSVFRSLFIKEGTK